MTEQEKIDKLLLPRYKVIADYPESDFVIGEIMEINQHGFYVSNRIHIASKTWFDGYPHLFQKLQWWQERQIEEMPDYVIYKDAILKVSKWFFVNSDLRFHVSKQWLTQSASECKPATLSEYEAQQIALK